jgi:hypothetical protein
VAPDIQSLAPHRRTDDEEFISGIPFRGYGGVWRYFSIAYPLSEIVRRQSVEEIQILAL